MLVVEDDPRSRKLLEGYLRGEGYDVRGASDGSAGLVRIKEEIPDVVLLDVMMPGMTGHEVCERIKADPVTRTCQVMMVTALAGTPDRVTGLDTGADDYVTKPVRRELFLAKVRALVRARGLLRELERAHTELQARNDELQLKKTLAQTLVHDLKNPLSEIQGNLELLELRAGAELQPVIERGKRGALRMREMILDLLDVEALEEGKLVPGSDPLDLAALVSDAVESVQVSASAMGITIVHSSPAESWALGDSALLRRVVDNLLANGIAHTPRQGKITIIVRPCDEGIEITVVDTGPGIPVELRDEVFEKYSHLKMKGANLTSNRGLGLTFCRLAVEAQGGTIWVESAPEGGACFRAILADAGEMRPAAELLSAVAEI